MNAAGATLIVIAGIRSQYIKLAALQRGVTRWNLVNPTSPVTLLSVNSGQHWSASLSTQYLEEYGVKFDVDFSGRHSSTEPNVVLGEMVTQLSDYLATAAPIADAVAVFGDANTTLAGAIAARRAALPLIHVEAGLRTHSDTPEEMNRVVADHLAGLHLASSRLDLANLVSEGLGESSTFTGDIVRDLFPDTARTSLAASGGQPFVLMTMHRAENTRDASIVRRLFKLLSARHLSCQFMAHPRVLTWAADSAANYPGIEVRESCGHAEMVRQLQDCSFVVTDSGALQREAFYAKRRAIVVQDRPFWKALTDAGIHRRCDPDESSLRTAIDWAVACWDGPYPDLDDFGQPPVSQAILSAIVEFVGRNKGEPARA